MSYEKRYKLSQSPQEKFKNAIQLRKKKIKANSCSQLKIQIAGRKIKTNLTEMCILLPVKAHNSNGMGLQASQQLSILLNIAKTGGLKQVITKTDQITIDFTSAQKQTNCKYVTDLKHIFYFIISMRQIIMVINNSETVPKKLNAKLRHITT